MVIYGIFLVICLVIIAFLAWRAPEGEQIPGVGFVEKKGELEEQKNNPLQDGRARLSHHNGRPVTFSGHRPE